MSILVPFPMGQSLSDVGTSDSSFVMRRLGLLLIMGSPHTDLFSKGWVHMGSLVLCVVASRQRISLHSSSISLEAQLREANCLVHCFARPTSLSATPLLCG